MIRTRAENLKISPIAGFPLPSIPLPNTAPAGPVSPCQQRSRNPTLNNRTETRSSFASGRGSRRKRGAASEAPWRSTPSGPWCDRSPGGTPDWDCSSVDSGPRSSDRNDCCRQRKPYVVRTLKGDDIYRRILCISRRNAQVLAGHLVVHGAIANV